MKTRRKYKNQDIVNWQKIDKEIMLKIKIAKEKWLDS